jgi:hypothetical protein
MGRESGAHDLMKALEGVRENREKSFIENVTLGGRRKKVYEWP